MFTSSLFLLANWDFLYLYFFANDKVVHQEKQQLANNFVEVFFTTLKKVDKQHSLILSQLTKIYAGIGPGSFTTHRAIVVFLKTLQVLNPRLQIWTIDNLLFQSGLGANVISATTLSRQKVCLQLFQDGEALFPLQVLWKNQLPAFLEKNPQFTYYCDFVGFDHWKCFQTMLDRFNLVANWNKLQPIEVQR